MAEPSIQKIITRDRSSNRVHIRLRYGDRWYVDERCQTDQSGSFLQLTHFVMDDEPPKNLCTYCFDGEV